MKAKPPPPPSNTALRAKEHQRHYPAKGSTPVDLPSGPGIKAPKQVFTWQVETSGPGTYQCRVSLIPSGLHGGKVPNPAKAFPLRGKDPKIPASMTLGKPAGASPGLPAPEAACNPKECWIGPELGILREQFPRVRTAPGPGSPE